MSDEQNVEQQDAENLTENQAESQDINEQGEVVELSTDQALEKRLENAEQRAADSLDQLLRTKAEMENLRRRTQRDLENAHKFALEKFARELLAVKDSLEMGLDASQQDNADVEKLREGTQMTINMLAGVFEKFEVIEVNPLNEKFNADHHQAVSMQETADYEDNTVMMVMQKGYLLNGRLIRPAMVVVSKAVTEKSE